MSTAIYYIDTLIADYWPTLVIGGGLVVLVLWGTAYAERRAER